MAIRRRHHGAVLRALFIDPDTSCSVPNVLQAVPNVLQAVPNGLQAIPNGLQAVPNGLQAAPNAWRPIPAVNLTIPGGLLRFGFNYMGRRNAPPEGKKVGDAVPFTLQGHSSFRRQDISHFIWKFRMSHCPDLL